MRKASVVAMLMIVASLLVVPGVPPAGALIVDTFEGGVDDVTVKFKTGGGVNETAVIVVPANTKVLSANMNLTGVPFTPGGIDYPAGVIVDVGADGDHDWEWTGTGTGNLGVQKAFWNDSKAINYVFDEAGKDTEVMVKLPTGANVTSAELDLRSNRNERFEEFKFTGNSLDWSGYVAGSVGDVNNDGLPDFMSMGLHRWGGSGPSHGYLYLGNETLVDMPDQDIIYTGSMSDYWGNDIDSAGDVNGDGYDDILLGVKYWGGWGPDYDKGAACIYYGGDIINDTPDLWFQGAHTDDEFGTTVAGVGDVNNDGYDDILIGAPYNNTPIYRQGSAYLFLGGPNMDNVSDYNITGISDYDYLGWSVAGVGDVNGDTYPDFAIGAEGDDNGPSNDGAVYIYFGGPGLDGTADISIRPAGSSYFGGNVEGVGDLNGDGYDDIAVSNALMDVWVFYGGDPMDTNRDLIMTAEGYYDEFGYYSNIISSAGDLNMDGFDELIIGAWGYNDSTNYDFGKAYLYWGGQNMDSDEDVVWVGEDKYDELGIQVFDVGDFNDDGFNDIGISADGDDDGGNGAGAVRLQMFKMGIKDPTIRFVETGATIWSHDGYFMGDEKASGLASLFNTALESVGVTETDANGNEFTVLTLNVSVGSDGDLMLKNMTIKYDLTVALDDLATEIQEYMDQNTPTDGFYHVPVRVISAQKGGVRLMDLEVVLDEAPTGAAPAEDLVFPEGGVIDDYLDLYEIFDDDLDAAGHDLTFLIKSHTNDTHVDAYIHQGRYLGIDALTNNTDINWTGWTRVVVQAVDTNNLRSEDITLDIEVYDVEDVPLITSTPPTEVMEGMAYTYDVEAIDGDTGDYLKYILVEAPAGMMIEGATGLIHWSPTIEHVGAHPVTINVTDGAENATQSYTLTVRIRQTGDNRLPVISSEPIRQATVGVTYTYIIQAVDDDWDPLTYSLAEAPDGMVINGSTGKVVWLPEESDVGPHNVSINVSDGKDRVFQRYVLTVTDVGMNHMPIIMGSPPSRAFVGIEYIFRFNSSDADGDSLTFSLQKGPDGLTLSGQGALTWTPLPKDVGVHSFTVRLSDGKAYVEAAYTIDVSVNHAPHVSSNPILDAKVGETYTYKIVVSDSDGDPVTVEVTRWPYGMTFDNATMTLTWTPAKDQEGANEVSIKVSDGKHSSTHDFTITVKPKKGTGPGTGGGEEIPWWILLVLIVVIVVLVVTVAVMRRKPKEEYIIEDVFLVYRDGRLMSHHTRRLKPETDEYSITAMLTAVQDFVKTSIPTEGEEQKPIQEISFGDNRILLQHGTFVYIAAVVTGQESEAFRERMKEVIFKIEDRFGSFLREWDGDLSELSGAKLLMKDLLKGPAEGEEEVEGAPEVYDVDDREAYKDMDEGTAEEEEEEEEEDEDEDEEEEEEERPPPRKKDKKGKK